MITEMTKAYRKEVHMYWYYFWRWKSFKYLQFLVTEEYTISAKIKTRIATDRRCLSALNKNLKDQSLSRAVKITIFKTIIYPVLIYGSECWVIFGSVNKQGSWWNRKKCDIEQLFCEPNIVAISKKGRLRWLRYSQEDSGWEAAKEDNYWQKEGEWVGIRDYDSWVM